MHAALLACSDFPHLGLLFISDDIVDPISSNRSIVTNFHNVIAVVVVVVTIVIVVTIVVVVVVVVVTIVTVVTIAYVLKGVVSDDR